ncbi:uncharacterized protein [Montipora capricornis]|uniref:uncharacterized protein n=1 Tax=Montipora capricornis TaxID=246305 RepID=UPI0035F1F44F
MTIKELTSLITEKLSFFTTSSGQASWIPCRCSLCSKESIARLTKPLPHLHETFAFEKHPFGPTLRSPSFSCDRSTDARRVLQAGFLFTLFQGEYCKSGHRHSVVTEARTQTIYRYSLSIDLSVAGFLVEAQPVPTRVLQEFFPLTKPLLELTQKSISLFQDQQ